MTAIQVYMLIAPLVILAVAGLAYYVTRPSDHRKAHR